MCVTAATAIEAPVTYGETRHPAAVPARCLVALFHAEGSSKVRVCIRVLLLLFFFSSPSVRKPMQPSQVKDSPLLRPIMSAPLAILASSKTCLCLFVQELTHKYGFFTTQVNPKLAA